MSKAALLTAFLALAVVSTYYIHQSSTKVDAFEQWKIDFGAEFELGEEPYRRLIFERNYLDMLNHNADSTQTYKKGINQFSIYTEEEFKLRFLSELIVPEDIEEFADIEEEEVAAVNGEVDWTKQGKVTPVKNQGQCGSCWAFSATGVTESWAKFKGQSVSLSEQQLVDCSRKYGNNGCNGGWPSNGLKYAVANGWASESEYPYRAKDGSCVKTGGSFKVNKWTNTARTCAAMQSQIMQAPLSVTVDASKWSSYHSGTFTSCGTSINHAVLLVGTDSSSWKIKNSWGTSWGEAGYIRLGNVGKNTCGVCSYGGVYVG